MEPLKTSETPIYILPQAKKRTIIPKITFLLILGIVFYLGILLNISLLNLSTKQESLTKTISLVILILVIIIGVILSFKKAKLQYHFYNNRISLGKNFIYYQEITNTTSHQDPLDKMFNSYSINLGHHFFLRHLPKEIQIENYLKQLINYSTMTSLQNIQQETNY